MQLVKGASHQGTLLGNGLLVISFFIYGTPNGMELHEFRIHTYTHTHAHQKGGIPQKTKAIMKVAPGTVQLVGLEKLRACFGVQSLSRASDARAD